MKRTVVAIASISLFSVGLIACQTATPYQPIMPNEASEGGYSNAKLTNDSWRVVFSGNTLTSRETVERYLLYRAAELTVDQGFDWFITDDKHTEKSTRTSVDPVYGVGWSPVWRFRNGAGWNGWSSWGGSAWGAPLAAPATVTQYNRYEVSATIVMGKETAAAGEHALNARELLKNLGPEIVRPNM